MTSSTGEASGTVTIGLDEAVRRVQAAFDADTEAFWAAKRACAAADAVDGTGGCGCAYKDCYDHGKWHNCPHGAPDWGPRAVAALTGEGPQAAGLPLDELDPDAVIVCRGCAFIGSHSEADAHRVTSGHTGFDVGRTGTGKVVTTAEIDEWAAEAEAGYDITSLLGRGAAEPAGG